jgi:hypothetical protein
LLSPQKRTTSGLENKKNNDENQKIHFRFNENGFLKELSGRPVLKRPSG